MKEIQEDIIISEFLKSIGPWNKFIVIGGGFALFIYRLYLSQQTTGNFPIGTRDIDSLIPRKLPEISKKNISKHLLEAGFKHLFKDTNIPSTSSYIKEIDGIEVEIEFLTDNSTRLNKNKNVIIGGVVAQPLSYLNLSLQTTRQFQTFAGKIGHVVAPSAWIFHKGLTFPKRTSNSKSLKDLYGIWYLASQLGSFSVEVLEEFKSLTKQHSTWFQTLRKNLSNWVENATPKLWSELEFQDPSGTLRKQNFEHLVHKLLKN